MYLSIAMVSQLFSFLLSITKSSSNLFGSVVLSFTLNPLFFVCLKYKSLLGLLGSLRLVLICPNNPHLTLLDIIEIGPSLGFSYTFLLEILLGILYLKHQFLSLQLLFSTMLSSYMLLMATLEFCRLLI